MNKPCSLGCMVCKHSKPVTRMSSVMYCECGVSDPNGALCRLFVYEHSEVEDMFEALFLERMGRYE